MTKELRLTLKVRNNRLIKAREALGLGAREASKRIGVSYGDLLQLESLKLSPLGRRGVWRPSVLRIAAFYGNTTDYFWPDAVMAVVEPERTVEVDAMDVARLGSNDVLTLPDEAASAEEMLNHKEEAEFMLEYMTTLLTEREQNIVRLHFGLDGHDALTLQEIGEHDGGTSRERVRQILEGALGKLRRGTSGYGRGFRSLPPRPAVHDTLAKLGQALCPACRTPFSLSAPIYGRQEATTVKRTCSVECAVLLRHPGYVVVPKKRLSAEESR